MYDFFSFPDMKLTFIPDPGHTFFEIDLGGADARVVAWRAKNEGQKNAFRKGIKIHTHNGSTIWGREAMGPDGKAEPQYTRAKKGVHATHYGAKNAAARCGMTESEWREFQKRYLGANPETLDWMEEVKFTVQTKRKISNAFGWDVTFYDRPDSVIPDALAWEPSSTVALVTYEAMRLIRETPGNPGVDIRLQIHDSLAGQVPTPKLRECMRWLHPLLHSIVVPFDDPLIIPWDLKLSDKSWGDCKDVKWEHFLNEPVCEPA